MGRRVQVTHGEYLGLNESDPELAMRDAQREYYDNDQEIDISFTTETWPGF